MGYKYQLGEEEFKVEATYNLRYRNCQEFVEQLINRIKYETDEEFSKKTLLLVTM